MKAITLPPEHAALVAAGVQTIVTFARPPRLAAGDRLAIHAGGRLPRHFTPIGEWKSHTYEYVVGGPQLRRLGAVERDGRTLNQDHIIPLHPGHIVASAVVRDVVPIANFFTASCPGDDTPHLCMYGDQSAQLYPGSEEPQHGDDITDQLPFADFTPGRWAVLLDDVTPTTDRCPACWGTWAPCRVCFTPNGYVGGEGTCPPIPWRGGTGVREWTP